MAQGVIGNLRVVISADSARFTRGMSDVQRKSKQVATRLKALSAVGVAAGAALTAIAIRAGQSIDAQAKLAQSLNTTVGSMQVLERAGELAGVSVSGLEQASKDLTRRLSQAASGTGPAVDALKELGLSANDLMRMPLDERIVAINEAINQFVPAAEQAAMAGRLFGEEGSIAAMRLQPEVIKQATDEIDRLGLRISEIDASRIEAANDRLSELGLVSQAVGQKIALTVLPALASMASAMVRAFEVGQPLRVALDALLDNVQRLGTYAVTAATILSGRLVVSIVAAKVATISLSGALVALRGALVRTGLGALVVIAGELVFQFSKLKSSIGSVGETFSALKGVAAEAWGRMVWHIDAVGMRVTAFNNRVGAGVTNAMATALEAVQVFTNKTIGAFVGAGNAITAVFKAVPGVVGEGAVSAANAVIDAINTMMKKAASAFDALTASMAASWVGDKLGISGTNLAASVDLSPMENKWAGSISSMADAATGAFSDAFSHDYTGPMAEGMRELASGMNETADAAEFIAKHYTRLGNEPLESVQTLRDAIAKNGEETEDAEEKTRDLTDTIDDLGEAAAGKNGSGKGGSGGAAGAVDKMEESLTATQVAAQDLAKKFKSGLTSAIDNVGDAFGQLFTGGIKSFKDFASKIFGGFKKLLADMISTAIANPIKIGLGLITGTGAAAAPGGGLLSGLMGGGGGLSGMLGGIMGTWGGSSGILGGLSSVVGGFMNGGLGGAFSGLSGALGGGLTSAIGGLIPVVGVAAAAFSFFKSKTKLLDSGIRLTADGASILAEEFKKVKKTRFWGLSKKVRTSYKRADDEVQRAMQNTYDTLRSGVTNAAGAIGLAGDALDNFSAEVKLSTKGMSSEEAQRAVQEELSRLTDEMALEVLASAAPKNVKKLGSVMGEMLSNMFGPFTFDVMEEVSTHAKEWAQQFIKEGESAGAALERLGSSIVTINPILEDLGFRAYEVSLSGAQAASALADLFGGLQNAQKATQSYYLAFYSESERLARVTDVTKAALADLGHSMPETREGFRALVDAQNMMTDSGREMFAALIQLSPAMDQIYTASEQAAAQAVQSSELISDALDAADESLQALSDTVRKAMVDRQDLLMGLRTDEQIDADVAKVFRDLNIEMPDTVEGLQDIIRGLDLTGEAGRKALVQISSISSDLTANIKEQQDAMAKAAEEQRGALAAMTETVRDATIARQNLLKGLRTDDQKADDLAKLFDTLNLSIPETVEGLQALIRGFDLTTEAGRAAFEQISEVTGQLTASIAAQQEAIAKATATQSDLLYNLMTDQERAAASQARIAEVFASLNLVVPKTIDGLRAVVQGLDLTGEAGRAALDKIASVSDDLIADIKPKRSTYSNSSSTRNRTDARKSERERLRLELWRLQGRVDLIRKHELKALDKSNRALQRQIWALEDLAKTLDAIDSTSFGTLAEYELARARAANRTTAPPVAETEKKKQQENSDAQTDFARETLRGINRLVRLKFEELYREEGAA